MITIKSKKEIEIMQKGGIIAAKAQEAVSKEIAEGVTTIHLDKIASSFIKSMGAIPSFLNYNGFPKNICVSVNNEVVHGIPGLKKLKNGDIVSVDIGVLYNGYHSDCARTYVVGETTEIAKKLINIAEQSFFKGIEYAREGHRLSDISFAIQSFVEQNGFSVVRDLVGHGIGKELHEDPQIPNYGNSGKGPRLYSGMTFAIEPMINVGSYNVECEKNGWTIVTKDKKLSAHYENTILITKNKPVILTML